MANDKFKFDSTRTDTSALGTYHISTDLQNYETARSNFFQLIVENLDDLLYPEYSYSDNNLTDASYVTGKSKKKLMGQDVLRLSINKAFVPHFSMTPIEVRRGNSVVKFADTPTWDGNKTLEFQDFVGLETKSVLMAWQALAYDVMTDTQGRAARYQVGVDGSNQPIYRPGYKKDCTLVEYTPDFQPIRYWKLIGCWISAIQESDFDVTNGGNGGRQITVTFEYDRAEMHINDFAPEGEE